MPQDKFGIDLKKGAHVRFVHMGEYYESVVEKVGEELHSPHLGNVPYIEAVITATIPAGLVEVFEPRKKDKTPEATPSHPSTASTHIEEDKAAAKVARKEDEPPVRSTTTTHASSVPRLPATVGTDETSKPATHTSSKPSAPKGGK